MDCFVLVGWCIRDLDLDLDNGSLGKVNVNVFFVSLGPLAFKCKIICKNMGLGIVTVPLNLPIFV